MFLIGVAGLILGAVAVRSAALLSGRIDPDLVTTPELASFGAVALGAQAALVLLGLWSIGAGTRWAQRMSVSLAGLGDAGSLLAPARRTARLAMVLAIGGLLLVIVAAIGLVVPLGRDVARALWIVTAVGSLALPVSAGLLIWLISDIERREAAAIFAVDPWQPVPGERNRRWPIAAIALLAVLAVVPPSANIPYLWSDHVCHAADLECRWIIVQADQLANDPRGTTTILHYGLHRATGARVGTLVMATGGPGVSGIAAYDQSATTLDARLAESFDIVAFDARGVGESGHRDCPTASASYSERFDLDRSASVVETFVSECLAETGVDRSTLGAHGSAQIAEDIETIRVDLGVERIVLYGESYGTAIAQRYAQAHPDRLDALILDAPLDIATPTDRSWAEATASFDSVLARAFGACSVDPACAEDVPDPDAAWGHVVADLDRRIESAAYADVDGEVTTWPLSRADVIGTLLDALYDESGRMLALRALGAADAGDWVPMARLVYSGFIYARPSEASSEFAYYATWCADRVAERSESGVADYLDAARRSGLATGRTGSVYLSGAPCHAWPLATAEPPSSTAPQGLDAPVVILTATADPITPSATARRLVERYRATTDAYLVATVGGPHVTFGRGVACPDDLVVDLLIDDVRPSSPDTSCPGRLLDPYVGLARPEAGDDELSFLGRALDAELLAHPDYRWWSGQPALSVGCRFGGRMQVRTATDEDRIDVRACEASEGDPMTGTAVYRDDGTAKFDVTFPRGTLRYEVDADGLAIWSGTYDGRTVGGRD